MAKKEYQRLTFARMRRGTYRIVFATRSSLWLGSDHLLSIDSTGYGEDYKRFFFRDIQAMLVVASVRRITWNWVLGVITVPFLAAFVTAALSRQGWDLGALITFGIFTFLGVTGLLVNNLLGPTCVCYIRTAVQTEELPSLNRVRRVHKVLKRIRPLIAAAQGELSREEIAARMPRLGVEAAVPGNPPFSGPSAGAAG